jgi:hypothetical protein
MLEFPQFAGHKFPLDFQDDHEEKNDRQGVVDPPLQRHAKYIITDDETEFLLPESNIGRPQGRVGHRQGHKSGQQQYAAIGGFDQDKPLQGIDQKPYGVS